MRRWFSSSRVSNRSRLVVAGRPETTWTSRMHPSFTVLSPCILHPCTKGLKSWGSSNLRMIDQTWYPTQNRIVQYKEVRNPDRKSQIQNKEFSWALKMNLRKSWKLMNTNCNICRKMHRKIHNECLEQKIKLHQVQERRNVWIKLEIGVSVLTNDATLTDKTTMAGRHMTGSATYCVNWSSNSLCENRRGLTLGDFMIMVARNRLSVRMGPIYRYRKRRNRGRARGRRRWGRRGHRKGPSAGAP